jgi:hypothetical protein
MKDFEAAQQHYDFARAVRINGAEAKGVQTPETVGNQFGYLCPRCGQGNTLVVSAMIWVALLSDGTENDTSDTEFDRRSPARCRCGWTGKVGDFKQAENFEGE